MENVTKGEVTISPQIGEFPNCMQAQIWSSAGISLAVFEPTINPVVATENAMLAGDAFNTHNTTGYTPSQLLEQNRELVEALTRINQMSDSGNYITSLLDCKKIAREAITKHSKDV